MIHHKRSPVEKVEVGQYTGFLILLYIDLLLHNSVNMCGRWSFTEILPPSLWVFAEGRSSHIKGLVVRRA